jgi:cellulose synthase/poly-beta-1,6-N-acetylglucosamine synthase-like glycosyltransferase
VTTQTYRDLDIVVVDGASTDKTAAIVHDISERDPRVRLVENPAAITPVSMNVGLREARGRWLVRIDAHATVPADYVTRVMAHLATGKWGGVGGRKDGVGFTSAGKAIAVAMASPFGVGGSTYHHGTELQTVEHIPFGAYPTELARAIGGWDERLRVNQDFEFDWRMRQSGHELLFDPELRIDWVCRQSTAALLKQYWRYGRGKARVAALHPRSLSPRHLIPPLFVVYLAAALVLAPFRPLLALVAVAPYLAFVAAGSIATARRLRLRESVHLPLIFMAMHLGWGAGFLRGAIDVITRR